MLGRAGGLTGKRRSDDDVLDTYNILSNPTTGSRSATLPSPLKSRTTNKEKTKKNKLLTRLLLGGLQTIPRTPHSRVPVIFLPRRAGHVEGRGGVGDDAYVLDYVLGEMDGMEGLNRENGEDGVDVDVG
jgi:hypothetical protein